MLYSLISIPQCDPVFLFCRSFLKDFALEVMQQNRHKVTVPFSYGSLVSGLIHPSDLHGKIYGQFMGNMGKSTYNWSELNHLDEQLSYWVLLMRFSWAINGVTCWLTTLLISKKQPQHTKEIIMVKQGWLVIIAFSSKKGLYILCFKIK